MAENQGPFRRFNPQSKTRADDQNTIHYLRLIEMENVLKSHLEKS